MSKIFISEKIKSYQGLDWELVCASWSIHSRWFYHHLVYCIFEPSQPVLNTAGAVSTIGIICLLKAWPHASENHKKLVWWFSWVILSLWPATHLSDETH